MPAYSGLWNGVYAEAHSLLVNKSPINRRISQALRRRSSTVLREVIDTVANGSSINGAAAVTYRRVGWTPSPGSDPVGGGRATIETVTKIQAGSTVNSGTPQVSAAVIDGLVDYSTRPSTYPVDTSGNGGGDRLNAQYAVNG